MSRPTVTFGSDRSRAEKSLRESASVVRLVSAHDRRGARTAVHQRDLAEEVTGDQAGQRASVRVLDLGFALDEHVEDVAGLPLADDRRALHEPLLVHLVGEPLQEARRHAGEQRHLCERISCPERSRPSPVRLVLSFGPAALGSAAYPGRRGLSKAGRTAGAVSAGGARVAAWGLRSTERRAA